MEPIVASGAYGVEPLGGGPAEASTPSPAVMEPTVASGAYGVEPLGGGPAKASTPSPAFKDIGTLLCSTPGCAIWGHKSRAKPQKQAK